MKNLLSENMLRFGTKNLTPNQQRELVAKSIMETINQHGLANVIKKKLTEQSLSPAELKASGMDGGTMKQIGAVDKQLGTSQKNTGVAQKIAGQLMSALSGADSEEEVLTALQMIPKYGGQKIYDSLIWVLKNNKNIKSKFGKNYNLVSSMISDNGISFTGADGKSGGNATPTTNPFSKLKMGLTDQEWIPKYKEILDKYSSMEDDWY